MHNPAGSTNPAVTPNSNPVPEFISINREKTSNDSSGESYTTGPSTKAKGRGYGRGGGVVYGAPKATPTRSSLVTSSGSRCLIQIIIEFSC